MFSDKHREIIIIIMAATPPIICEQEVKDVPKKLCGIPFTILIATEEDTELPLEDLCKQIHSNTKVNDKSCSIEAITELSPSKALFHFSFEAAFLSVAVNENMKAEGKNCTVSPLDRTLTRITVSHLPGFVPKLELFKKLSNYGNVYKIDQDCVEIPDCPGLTVPKSTRKVLMRMYAFVPNIIFVDGFQAVCEYTGVPTECNLCCGTDHANSPCPYASNEEFATPSNKPNIIPLPKGEGINYKEEKCNSKQNPKTKIKVFQFFG